MDDPDTKPLSLNIAVKSNIFSDFFTRHFGSHKLCISILIPPASLRTLGLHELRLGYDKDLHGWNSLKTEACNGTKRIVQKCTTQRAMERVPQNGNFKIVP